MQPINPKAKFTNQLRGSEGSDTGLRVSKGSGLRVLECLLETAEGMPRLAPVVSPKP